MSTSNAHCRSMEILSHLSDPREEQSSPVAPTSAVMNFYERLHHKASGSINPLKVHLQVRCRCGDTGITLLIQQIKARPCWCLFSPQCAQNVVQVDPVGHKLLKLIRWIPSFLTAGQIQCTLYALYHYQIYRYRKALRVQYFHQCCLLCMIFPLKYSERLLSATRAFAS